MATVAEAQVRGVYPTGMNATNAGVTPESGFTYSNLFIFNARDQSKGPDGEIIVTGSNAVMNERDPFIGTQDGSYNLTIPKRPIKKKIKGAYFFLPGIKALRFLAGNQAESPS